jgi:hypothetical protein
MARDSSESTGTYAWEDVMAMDEVLARVQLFTAERVDL